MRHLLRRQFLLASAALPVVWTFAAGASSRSAQERLEQLERDLGGRLGVFALDSADGACLGHRADELFPLCSTFKAILAAAILQRSTSTAGLLEQRINYAQSALVEYSPITERHLADGMTVAELCAAAVQYSDNTAANLLMELLGGPAEVTAFARSIGDPAFRLDRWETELNTAIPGDPRDTTTPSAMGHSLQRLVLGDALGAAQRKQLADWLLGNTTGATRIRAGVPSEWRVGDKTGTGVYGTANDVAVLWPPQRPPVIVAIYTTRHDQDAEARNDVIADATRVVVDWLDTKTPS
ncbi:class A beta-lactamase [Zestomonas carbonaria]|uniref:Beta-lactamase n=1 Tax=Zestomonas carbonaria TaxID=2762745 RepID=A0A7U7ERE4_9GAMM|nr:class A beta-lactamase [Pseudomonas carbonaria]CAD5108830.1 Carbapenem-hydrolyzing beta-lactamase KPC [Pseudomonas carbonaria]